MKASPLLWLEMQLLNVIIRLILKFLIGYFKILIIAQMKMKKKLNVSILKL